MTDLQREALLDLHRYGECEPSRMDDSAGLDGGMPSSVLRALAKKGLVERVQAYEAVSRFRSRPSVYRITDAGREALGVSAADVSNEGEPK